MDWFKFLRKFHFVYQSFFGITAYVLNALVFFLVLTRSSKFTRHYRRILLLNCMVDVLFTTVTLLTMEIPEIKGDCIFMITDGLLPKSWAIHADVFWIFALYQTVVNVPMTFLSRYSVVCRSTPFTNFQYYSIYAGATCYVAVHAALQYATFDYGSSPKMEKYAKMLAENRMFPLDDQPGFSVGDATNLITAVHFSNALVIMSVSYSVVAFTGYRIWTTLNKKRHLMSKSTISAHNNLSWILSLQACYPFFTVALPLFVANFLPFLGIQTMYLGFLMDLVGTLIPTLNALSVLAIIPTFRSYVCNFRLNKSTTAITHLSHSQSQLHSNLPSTHNQKPKEQNEQVAR